MEKLLLTIIILCTAIHTGFSAEEIDPEVRPRIVPDLVKVKKITRKPINTLRKKPRKRPIIYHRYYTTTIEKNCDRYIHIINEKNREIEALTKEINNLRANRYESMRQLLKEEYDKEMKKFEERRKSY